MNQLPHTVIRASAGTGKTHALTNRILTLLLGGVKPERIIALTFNRTAAGEIFDTVIGRLAKASRSGEEAAKLAEELREVRGREPLDAAKCRETLRRLLLRMHLSPIGTIDSFFVKIIRAFPFEHGISGEFAIAGENEQRLQRERILRTLLQPPADEAEAREQRGFFESFKRATFGREEKRLHDLLADFVDEYHQLYLDAADLARWGGAERIWGRRTQWRQLPEAEQAKTADALRDALAAGEWTPEQRGKWEEFLEFAAAFTPESPCQSADIPAVLAKLLEVLPADPAEDGAVRAKITLRKEVELSEAASGHAFRLVRHVGACVLHARRETTRGIGEILARFDAAYDSQMRRAGRLTFGDIQFLLSGGHAGIGRTLSGGGQTATEMETEKRKNGKTEEGQKLAIDYRLDAAYDHWALDEFQDTSRRQWRVIENLLDEVIQDPSGGRSSLIVGDVKQAIYGWRGGDSRLMEEIIGKYNGGGRGEGNGEITGEGGRKKAEGGSGSDILQVQSLVKTWRCRPAIIETVNKVFTRLERTRELDALGVREDWERLWETHESALKDAGHVAFRILPKETGTGAASAAEARMDVVCRRLLEVRPWERGLTAAVLVRGNKAGRLALDCLRRSQIPSALFGEERLADNPLVLACLSLVKTAAHPGDTLAWEHLRMTPLAPSLPPRPGRLAEAFLEEVHDRGFEAALRPWVVKILDSKPLVTEPCDGRSDSHTATPSHRHAGFTRRRAEQLLAAAQEFDADGSKDCMEFAGFVQDYRLSEPPGAGAVQIMTMHKSKGLGFDLVFLPDLQGDNICSAGIKGLHADTGADGATRWVLEMPGQAFSGADAALHAAVRRADRAGCFGELCLLYVAMTRAKRELQIVATEPGKTARSVYLATVLANALAGAEEKAEGKRQKSEGRKPAPADVGGNRQTSAAIDGYRRASADIETTIRKNGKTEEQETPAAGQPFYACGEADWWKTETGATVKPCTDTTVEAGRETRKTKRETPAARTRHPRRLPSHAKAEPYPAGNLFAAASAKGRAYGTALHELFQEVTWSGGESAEAIIGRWRMKKAAPAGMAEEVERAFRRALVQPEIADALRKPERATRNARHETFLELWREKCFELILDGEWVSGTMDRVVLLRNAAGVAESAEILDYKSDRIADEAALRATAQRHTPQMALYRRVLARLTGLPPEKIRCRLLFTGAARAVDAG